MNMGSYSNSSSDSEEELPVFDFLIRTSQSCRPNVDGAAAILSSAEGTGRADVMMMSESDDDDDAPYIPLAQRLKQRRDNVLSSSSAVTNWNHAEPPSSLSSIRQVQPSNTVISEGLPALLQHCPLSTAGSTGLSPPRGKQAKSTAEEIQASREEALKRRQDRERQQRDKEALRQEQEREKAERKMLAEAVKALRPDECIKHMVVVVDPALLQLEGGGTLLAAVQALGCSCAIEKQPLPRSVSWMRRLPCAQPDDIACTPEPHVLMQMTDEDMVTLVHNYVQEERLGNNCGPTLTSWVQEQQRRNPGKTLRIVVIDLEKYFKSQKSQSLKKCRDTVTGEVEGKRKKRRKNGGAQLLPEVSRVQVEEAVVHLQLHTGVSVCFLSTWKDFTDHVAMTTKAVAEAPFKREREKTNFSFYLGSDWAGGHRVDKTGKGLLQVWKRQIQQLNRVSPDMASAILAAYPSPQLLNKAYNKCQTHDEKSLLLSELLIRRGEGIISTTRRVGSELSKRLYLVMNSRDPEHAVDYTS